jgi:(2S)-methylsuccinyl-CoA dehydrogenase
MTAPDLATAASVVETAHDVVDAGIRHLAASGGPDANQVVAYDIAHAASAVATGRAMLAYGARGDLEGRIACAYIADAVGELVSRLFGRESDWNIEPGALDGSRDFVSAYRAPEFLASLADTPGPRHLDADFEMVQDTFRRFANDKIVPVAEHIHRTNADIPEDIIQGLAELGGFGLSVPVEYDGYSEGGASEYIGMVVATEELARASLGAGGSLITRPAGHA